MNRKRPPSGRHELWKVPLAVGARRRLQAVPIWACAGLLIWSGIAAAVTRQPEAAVEATDASTVRLAIASTSAGQSDGMGEPGPVLFALQPKPETETQQSAPEPVGSSITRSQASASAQQAAQAPGNESKPTCVVPLQGAVRCVPETGAKKHRPKAKFLPVPIFITNPAVGNGGGLALAYLRDTAGVTPGEASATQNIYGVAAARTSNGSWFYAGGVDLHFNRDRWRYRGLVGNASIYLDYYTHGGTFVPSRQVAYNLRGTLLFQQVFRRIGQQELFVGLSWVYTDLSLSFAGDRDRQIFQPSELAQRSSGLGVSLKHDSRDNPYTPSSGWLGEIDAYFYSPSFGGDADFQTYAGHVYAYLPLFDKRLVLGGRVDVSMADGNVPFYRLPYISLRGIPALRYQDTRAATVETELRWNFAPRWAWVGFAGVGRTWGRFNSFGDGENHSAKGMGLRYLLFSSMGLYVGADYAWGPEDQTVYIEIGSAWHG